MPDPALLPEDLWPAVARFSSIMRQKLDEKKHKGGWEGCKSIDLLFRMYQEINELEMALQNEDPVAIARECADIANFAMMIADNAGGLK